MITPNKYYFKKYINMNNKIYKNHDKDKKFGINQYKDKIIKLKISEV